MSPLFFRALFYIGLAILSALIVGWFSTDWAGWAVLCAGITVQLVFHLKNFSRLDTWSKNPKVDAALTGGGLWGHVFGRLYQHEKDMDARLVKRDHELGLFIAAAQALTDGVVLLDQYHRIAFINAIAQEQLGLSAHKDRGQTITHLLRQPEFVDYVQHADYTQPLILYSERNKNRVFSIFIMPFAANHQLMQIKDITQSMKIEQMRRDFVANVSHELRTPLTVLSGFLEFIGEASPDQEEQKRYFAMMTDQTRRMQSIVQDLLALSSIESAPPPGNETVDMTLLMDKLFRDAQVLSGGKHRIEMFQEASADLLGSESELIGAFSNLVSNAIRYTPEGGRITIRWDKEGDGACFSVEDTGIGIEAQHIARLTERFYRVDRGRSREAGGTGLGLAIVKHSLNRHQAKLKILSTPGKGSRFGASFPENRLVLPNSSE